MVNTEWIIASAGAAALIIIAAIIMFQRKLRDKRTGFPQQSDRTLRQELMTLGSTLVVLGIVFSTDRLIAYSFMAAGVLLSIISVVKSKKKARHTQTEVK